MKDGSPYTAFSRGKRMFPSFKYFVKVYQLAVHKNVILCSFKACLHICSKNKVLGWKSRNSVTSTQTKSLIIYSTCWLQSQVSYNSSWVSNSRNLNNKQCAQMILEPRGECQRVRKHLHASGIQSHSPQSS